MTEARRVRLRDPDEGWLTTLDGRSRAVGLDAPCAGIVNELEERSLSSVVLEGFEGVCQVERLEDLATPFALVRAERRHRGRVVWLLFELVNDEPDAAREGASAKARRRRAA